MNKKQVSKFQSIYKKEFGESISHEEALEYAEKLISLVRNIYKPIKKDVLKNNNTTLRK